MYERMKRILIKEFIQIFRDRKMKGIIFLTPIIQVLVFGYAVTTDVKHVATAVYDLDNSVASRELTGRFEKSGYFDIIEYIHHEERNHDVINQGKIKVILRMNKGFENDLRTGRTAQLQVIIDGTDSNTAGVVLDYTTRIVGQFSQKIVITRFAQIKGPAQKPAIVNIQSRAWFNENLESHNFYVPGVIAIIVMLITLMLTSMAIVREKEIGTIEQIIVSPITQREFILGKTVPFALIGIADVIVITVIGVFWFGIPIRGSFFILFIATVFYLMTTLAIGLLISTVSKTQQEAMMSVFLFYFPAVLLSGFMFPIANMPVVVQWLTYINPLRYFLVILRGVFLKGVGLDILWLQMVALVIIGTTTLWFASRRFRKTIN